MRLRPRPDIEQRAPPPRSSLNQPPSAPIAHWSTSISSSNRPLCRSEEEVTTEEVFSTGDSEPKGDAARQAVAALRGYAYQVVSATLEWLHLADDGYLILEVAEDYAFIADGVLRPAQVKDTARSGPVTLVSESVVRAVGSFVGFANRYTDRKIEFVFVTTSEIGTERAISERPAGMPGLQYWKKVSARATSEEIEPLRAILQSDRFPEVVRTFCAERDDYALHRDLIQRVKWECGKGDLDRPRNADRTPFSVSVCQGRCAYVS